MTETTFTQQLLEFEQASVEFIKLAEQYPEDLQTEAGVCGEWSAREVIAHINGWLVEAQRRYPRYAKGTGNIDYNIDAFNNVSVWLRDGKDFEQILEEFRQLTSVMATKAHEIAPEYIERDNRYEKWLAIFLEEYDVHGAQLRDFLEAQPKHE